jgi:hypothetical protein
MILWVAVAIALAVATMAAIGLGISMSQAERRARSNLYRALGIGEEATDLCNSDVLSVLARLRKSSVASDAAARSSETPDAEGHEAPSDQDQDQDQDSEPLRARRGVRSVPPGDGRLPTA